LRELPEVRIALPQEEENVMELCRRLHSENGIFSLNEDKVRDNIRKCYERKGTIVGVIGEIGKLEACTCLCISDMHYTNDWHLMELWNYVAPEYRKSRNAEALIEFAKGCAEKMGIPLFTGIITETKLSGKVRLYRRRLGNPSGAFFIYNGKVRADESVEMPDYSDLRRKLSSFADRANHRLSKDTMKNELIPLLREASEALRSIEKEFWMAGTKNGTDKHLSESR
jgi:hypothetical protein